MVSNEPNVNPKSRYSVVETCELLGICRNTLQLYTNKGMIRCGFRRANSRKFYLGSEIKRFWASQY